MKNAFVIAWNVTSAVFVVELLAVILLLLILFGWERLFARLFAGNPPRRMRLEVVLATVAAATVCVLDRFAPEWRNVWKSWYTSNPTHRFIGAVVGTWLFMCVLLLICFALVLTPFRIARAFRADSPQFARRNLKMNLALYVLFLAVAVIWVMLPVR